MPHVMVIEDDEAVRRVIATALREEGHLVDEAVDGEAAFALIGQRQPDVLLLDLKMPGMDGWEFIRRYRDRYRRPSPILVLTAATHPEARGYAAGADDVLAKPFDLDELDARIRALVIRRDEPSPVSPIEGVPGLAAEQ